MVRGSRMSSNVKISGGVVTERVYGGFSSMPSDVSNNTVEISDGEILGDVIGGMSETGQVHDNTVIISGGTIGGEVYAGYSPNDVYNNTVSIRCSTEIKEIIGGYSYEREASGNTLHIAAKGITAKKVKGFQVLMFTLPSNIANGDTLLSIEEESGLAGMNIDTSKFEFAPGVRLARGDKITLVHNFGSTVGTITGNTYECSEGTGKGHASLEGNDLVYTIDEEPENKERRITEQKYAPKETENIAPITYTPAGTLTTTIISPDAACEPYDHFTGVLMNGQTLTRDKHYRAERGSLILTILPEALKDLPKGDNKLTVLFNDGEVSLTFDLAKLSKKSPNTGEF